MASTWLLKQQLISEYHTLIEQLESKYANQIAALLKQKKEIIVTMQQAFDQQMELINNFNQSTNGSCSPSNINQRFKSRVNISDQESVRETNDNIDNNNISNIPSLEHWPNRIDKNDGILKSVQSEQSQKNTINATSLIKQKTNSTEKKEKRYKCNDKNCYKSMNASNINQRFNSRVNILQQNNTYNEESMKEINGISSISSLEHAQNGIDKNKEIHNNTNIATPLMKQTKKTRKLKLLIRKKKKVNTENSESINGSNSRVNVSNEESVNEINASIPNIASLDTNDGLSKSVQSEESHKNSNNATSLMRQKTNNKEKKEKRYNCNHQSCYKSYEHKSSLKRHIMIIHTEQKSYKCHHYSTEFHRKYELNRHVMLHTGERPFKCDHCDKRFRVKAGLTVHVRNHTGERPFKCNYCDKRFTGKGNLTKHVRIHTGETPYKCQYCSKGFAQKIHLTVHVRNHTGERPFKCNYCDKRFTGKGNLTKHVRIHTGEKPYKCQYCSKAFPRSDQLTIHVRKHTGEKPYKCSKCNKSFVAGYTRNAHVLKCNV